MRNKTKSIVLLLFAILLMATSVRHTIAYLTDVDVSTSKFDVPVSEQSEEAEENGEDVAAIADDIEESIEPEESTTESAEPASETTDSET